MEHGEGAAHVALGSGVVLLAAALLFVIAFRKLGLGATLGYLVAGAVVGPQVLGLAGGAEETLVIGEFGIVMLLFIVGLELAPSRLWRLRAAIFGLGLTQVVLCGLALTGVLWLATSYPMATALAVGLSLGLSSTAQVLPMLQSGGNLRTPVGERAFSILLFQDLSIIPLLAIVAALGTQGGDQASTSPLVEVLIALGATIGLVLAGRFALRPLLRLIGRLGEREMFVVAALFAVVASAAVMQAIGLSTALGAFIAGVMLADTPYRHELEADIEPFRSILLGLFFISVGMMLDLEAIAAQPLFVLAMAAALVATKAAIITGLGMAVKLPWRSALALGLLLSQGGEFGFVLFNEAQRGGVIDAGTGSLFTAIVTISMATTPFLMMATRRLRAPARGAQEEREGPNGETSQALVIGFGRFGQTVAQMLATAGLDVTMIDRKVDSIDTAGNFGIKVFYGDGLRLDIMRQAGAGEAEVICFCIDGDQLEPDFIASVREAFPGAALFVRSYDRRTSIRLAGSDIAFQVRELRESAIAMSRAALSWIDTDEAEIDGLERKFRETDMERLRSQAAAGDMFAGKDAHVLRGSRAQS
ncbi:cation:proton antiporter domain-containing protein [Alteriqipengyuania lutimaris]|uniref:Sodium:proton exchanger n=1 Tax=Alteriqipengyuania lutimaris TaxID=1538146 RepID=A0A395LJK0_9SPHN|nr:cation:proton antiporter [Alteriqipengyuania lutimaris]MBB3034630.1 monovalent cation:proton antiporter-2 (CPA2) family protein [Alteriqipengyuania lutimaris]RDS76497.1 sodium:proton exchanger [Alteriqipengyuania lutimaris]